MTAEEFEEYKNTGKKILGYMPMKTPCVTCQTPDEEIPEQTKLPRKRCLIRQCVDKTGIANCAFCSLFPCDTLEETAGLWNRANIEAKLGTLLSDDEYHIFVEPFEGLNRLQAIRASLHADEIVEPAKASSKTRILKFPDNLFRQEGSAELKLVYDLLVAIENSSLGLKDTDAFAQQYTLDKRKAHILRFLWIHGNYGKMLKENGDYLVVDAVTYQANRGKEKTLSIWSFVEDVVFKMLAEFGVCCERITLKGVQDEDLTTGTGYLRKRGWVMRLTFTQRIGGAVALEAFQTYTTKLSQKYGSRAFKRFREVDMTF
jgi:hypothetical protein